MALVGYTNSRCGLSMRPGDLVKMEVEGIYTGVGMILEVIVYDQDEEGEKVYRVLVNSKEKLLFLETELEVLGEAG